MGILSRLASWAGFRSLENPRVPLDPWGPMAGEDAGMPSSSGMRVNRDRALTLAGFWRGVGLISNTVARTPLLPYKQLDPGKTPDTKHDAHWLLTRQPNEMMIPFVWKQTMQNHAVIEGNGYSLIERDGAARPLAMLILDPTRTHPVIAGGQLWYLHELRNGEIKKFAPDDILHIPGLGFDGLQGYSVISLMKEAAGLALATQKYGAVFYRNGSRPSIIIKHPAKLSPEARKNLREGWERINGGLDNAHRTAILEEGAEAQALTINARDSQLIESKQFSLIDLANFLHIPPHKLGSNTNISYASLEQENQAFLDDCISPWLTLWEQVCDWKLLTTFQRDRGTHIIQFDRSKIVIADKATRGAYFVQALSNGWMNQDEVREEEGQNPIPGGLGSKYLRPANLIPIDAPVPTPALPPKPGEKPPEPGADKPPPETKSKLVQSLHAILGAAIQRTLKRIGHQAERAAKKPAEYNAWVDGLAGEHVLAFEESLESPLTALREAGEDAGTPAVVAGRALATIRSGLLDAAGKAKNGAALEIESAAWITNAQTHPLTLLES